MNVLSSPHCCHGQAAATVPVLRLREGPDTATEIVGRLALSELVDVWIWDEGHGFARVQAADGVTGWASQEYLRVMGELTP